jgi:hypothetical protein
MKVNSALTVAASERDEVDRVGRTLQVMGFTVTVGEFVDNGKSKVTLGTDAPYPKLRAARQAGVDPMAAFKAMMEAVGK